jgi:hypothetical protein
MDEGNDKKGGWKQRVVHEAIEYWVIFAYMAIFFGAFAWYRRLVLAEYQIAYLNYGVALIEALVLAKVILVGDALGLGRGLEDKPLIIPAVYKAFVFTLFVGLFKILERTIVGLLHGKGLAGGWGELRREGKYELLAGCLVTFFAFVPFFSFKELGRVLGESKVRGLLFRKRTGRETGLSGGSNAEQGMDPSKG